MKYLKYVLIFLLIVLLSIAFVQVLKQIESPEALEAPSCSLTIADIVTYQEGYYIVSMDAVGDSIEISSIDPHGSFLKVGCNEVSPRLTRDQKADYLNSLIND